MRHSNQRKGKAVRTIKSVMREEDVKFAETNVKARRRAIVYLSQDRNAYDEALRVKKRFGGTLIPVRVASRYPSNPEALRARLSFEANWFVAAPIEMPAGAQDALAHADALTLVASMCGKRLAAPLAAFLERHHPTQMRTDVHVLVPYEHIAPVLYRDICRNLPRGSQVSFHSPDDVATLELIVEGWQ